MKDVHSLVKIAVLEIDAAIAKRRKSYFWYTVATVAFLWLMLGQIHDPWRSAWSSFWTVLFVAFIAFMAWGEAVYTSWTPGGHERLPVNKERFIYGKAHDLIKACGPDQFAALTEAIEQSYLPKTEGLRLLTAEIMRSKRLNDRSQANHPLFQET